MKKLSYFKATTGKLLLGATIAAASTPACTTGIPEQDCARYVEGGVRNNVNGISDAVAANIGRICVAHANGRPYNFSFGQLPNGIVTNRDCETTIDNAYELLNINNPAFEAEAVAYCSWNANHAQQTQARNRQASSTTRSTTKPNTSNSSQTAQRQQPTVITIDQSDLLRDCDRIVANPLTSDFTTDNSATSARNQAVIRNLNTACYNLVTTGQTGLPSTPSSNGYFNQCVDISDDMQRVLSRHEVPYTRQNQAGINVMIDYCNANMQDLTGERYFIWAPNTPWHQIRPSVGSVISDTYQFVLRIVD